MSLPEQGRKSLMQVQQAKNATEADLMRERAFVDQVLVSHQAFFKSIFTQIRQLILHIRIR
jgi:hypothetical protein